jgi:hypothetical protein
VLIFVLWFTAAVLIGAWSQSRGRSGGVLFLASLLLSPIVGALIVLIQGTDEKFIERAAIQAGGLRKCPSCAELVKAEAIKCRFCGEALTPILAATVPSAGKFCAVCQTTRNGIDGRCERCGTALV